jgi:uncharacterized coiled-coil protein SlyX
MKTRDWIMIAALGGCVGLAQAQSLEEKLRTQLRATTQQLRELQDRQAADRAQVEQQRDRALADLKDAQAELAKLKGQGRGDAGAARELAAARGAHAQDAKQLTQLRGELDALRAQQGAHEADDTRTQAELRAKDALLARSEAKNAALYAVGQEILAAYEQVGFGTFLRSREPFAQAARVKYDEIAQRYGDRLYDGRFDPRAAVSAPASASASASASSTTP